MSNAARPPFVAQHSIPVGVETTRWWWVRHAPVREDGGCIYGQRDLGCDFSERDVFEAVAKILPSNSLWMSSKLKRTHLTAQAIWDAGFPKPAMMEQDADLNEQHLGDWQGLNRAEFFANRPIAMSARSGSRRSMSPRRMARASPISIAASAMQSHASRLQILAAISLRLRTAVQSRRRSGLR